MSRPDVMEFMDYLTGKAENGSTMDVIEINKLTKDYRGLPLQQLLNDNLAEGLLIAIRSATGFLITPEPSLVLQADTKLFFLHQASARNSPALVERLA